MSSFSAFTSLDANMKGPLEMTNIRSGKLKKAVTLNGWAGWPKPIR